MLQALVLLLETENFASVLFDSGPGLIRAILLMITFVLVSAFLLLQLVDLINVTLLAGKNDRHIVVLGVPQHQVFFFDESFTQL